MKILIATGNLHKFNEIITMLPPKTLAGEPLEYVSLQEAGGINFPPEDGNTLAVNAQIKAVAAMRQSGLAALSDDTGLEVDALQGAPGVHTARYAGEPPDPARNNQKLLQELAGLFLGKRTARFRTVACLALPSGETVYFEGVLEGFISFELRGTNGFGYDPLFIVKGTRKTLAEMTADEKNKTSHRARAFEKAAAYLLKLQ